MAITVASLQAVLSLVKTNFDKGLKDSQKELTNFQKAQGGVNSVLQEFGVQLGAGVAVVGFTAEMGKMVQMGSAAEESFSKFNNIFGDFATTTRTELDGFAAAVGRNKFELRDFAAGFGALVTGMGMGGQEAGAFSVQLTKLTTDLSSFHNIAEKDVAAALQAGIIGETEPLRKFGVVLNQASLNAQLLKMGIEGGATAATESEKAQARLALILAATGTAQNDAAETSGSFANQLRRLQSAVAETETAIGQKLLPVATEIVNTFADLAQSQLPGVVEGFQSIASLGQSIKDMNTTITGLGVALGLIKEQIDPLASKFSILGTLVKINNLPFQGLSDIIKALSVGFGSLGGVIASLTGRWDAFNRTMGNTASILPNLSAFIAESPAPMAVGLKQIASEIGSMPSLGGAFGSTGGMVPMAAGGSSNITVNIAGVSATSTTNGDPAAEAIRMTIQLLRAQLNR